jgi:hypothetical protein
VSPPFPPLPPDAAPPFDEASPLAAAPDWVRLAVCDATCAWIWARSEVFVSVVLPLFVFVVLPPLLLLLLVLLWFPPTVSASAA